MLRSRSIYDVASYLAKCLGDVAQLPKEKLVCLAQLFSSSAPNLVLAPAPAPAPAPSVVEGDQDVVFS